MPASESGSSNITERTTIWRKWNTGRGSEANSWGFLTARDSGSIAGTRTRRAHYWRSYSPRMWFHVPAASSLAKPVLSGSSGCYRADNLVGSGFGLARNQLVLEHRFGHLERFFAGVVAQ